MVTAGTECMVGSEMYLTTTGMPYSHKKIFLSSEVVKIRLPSSQKVTVFTAPRCSSYSCTIEQVFASHCTAFLLEHPVTMTFCWEGSGCTATQKGVFLFVKVEMIWPVSVSQYWMFLSYETL